MRHLPTFKPEECPQLTPERKALRPPENASVTERKVRRGLLQMLSNDVRTRLWSGGPRVRGGTKGEAGKKTGREGDERGRLQEARGEWGRGLAKSKSELK